MLVFVSGTPVLAYGGVRYMLGIKRRELVVTLGLGRLPWLSGDKWHSVLLRHTRGSLGAG